MIHNHYSKELIDELHEAIQDPVCDAVFELDEPCDDDSKIYMLEEEIWRRVKLVLNITD